MRKDNFYTDDDRDNYVLEAARLQAIANNDFSINTDERYEEIDTNDGETGFGVIGLLLVSFVFAPIAAICNIIDKLSAMF